MSVVSRFIAAMGKDKLRDFGDAELTPILDETLDRLAAKKPLYKAAVWFLRDNAHEFAETLLDVTLERHSHDSQS